MGCVLSADIAHYRGEIKDGDYVIIAANNLTNEIDHTYTNEPFYLSKYDEITDTIYMESVSQIKQYEKYKEENGIYHLPIFEISFKYRGFTLMLANNEFCKNHILSKYIQNGGKLYLGMDPITRHVKFSHTPYIFDAVDIPNLKSPSKWISKSVLSDVGYVLQNIACGLSVLWTYNINTENIKNIMTYDQIRFIPIDSYYADKNGSNLCLKYPNNDISEGKVGSDEHNKKIKAIINNDILWAESVFQGKTSINYQRLYTNKEACFVGNWYEYCLKPNICSDNCMGPCFDKSSNNNKCLYINNKYSCLNNNDSENNIDTIKTIDNLDYDYVYYLLLVISAITIFILFLIIKMGI